MSLSDFETLTAKRIGALVKAEEVIQKAIEQLPEDWDALFLGYHDDAGRAHPGAFEQPAGEPIEAAWFPYLNLLKHFLTI